MAQSWSRIDRFLVSSCWEFLCLELIQKRLPRMYSDHFLILLESGRFRGVKKPFRFENIWLKVDGFVEKVKGVVVE